MEFECLPNDPQHYATNLRISSAKNSLSWDSANGQGALMVQTHFGENPSERLDEICETLQELGYLPNEFEEILPEIFVKYISAIDKAKNSGSQLNGEASRYTVYSCSVSDDKCKVYRSNDQAMVTSFKDIPLKVEVEINRVKEIKGHFKKKEVDTEFYSITFPDDLCNSYINSSVACKVNDIEIPITNEMIQKGTVYIKCENEPELVAKVKGLDIKKK